MKRLIAIALVTCAATSAIAQANVGVSIGISQPGVYGRIDIGNYPAPAVVYAEPMIVRPTRYSEYQRPIYLYAPPQHQQQWRRYCGGYSACGQPVYFVQEQWVRERYQQEHPRWRDRRGDRGERGDRDDRDDRDHHKKNRGDRGRHRGN